ncbi:alanine--glyoxylate aminotransferase 2, mitochondrial-like [Trichoplusia ni]|uniref:Alanine--glyoxylate aminotransferase 2, mitochondrial-like n=1 Tax=Trichoplusia ni TaxID=7111 RepID=A0A7E5X0V5_TRINI|nr:alanine--glyoxylate aminotransferase 2, mitochondrial-like [Trichoplusia ni]
MADKVVKLCCNTILRRYGTAPAAKLNSDFIPKQYVGPSYQKTEQVKSAHIPPAMYNIYKRPLLLHQGHMQYLFDHEGRRYLDLFGGIVTVSVGHCHP